MRVPSLGQEDHHLLQYSCLENPMDRGAWQATVHGVTRTELRAHTHTHTHTQAQQAPGLPAPPVSGSRSLQLESCLS